MPPRRLTKHSPAVRRLRAFFENGQITGNEKPNVVKQMYPVFTPFKAAKFRACFVRLKREFGISEGMLSLRYFSFVYSIFKSFLLSFSN